jgi:hypothetical protein
VLGRRWAWLRLALQMPLRWHSRMPQPVTWLHVLNLLWRAMAAAQPSQGWTRDYGWTWVEESDREVRLAATDAILSFALTVELPSAMPEAVRAEIYLRAMCAMDWALNARSKYPPPIVDELHDFVAWSMNTMWDEEGLTWAKRRLLPRGPMPELPSPGPRDASAN